MLTVAGAAVGLSSTTILPKLVTTVTWGSGTVRVLVSKLMPEVFLAWNVKVPVPLTVQVALTSVSVLVDKTVMLLHLSALSVNAVPALKAVPKILKLLIWL